MTIGVVRESFEVPDDVLTRRQHLSIATRQIRQFSPASLSIVEIRKDGDTALISTAEESNVDALKALLDAGAKVDLANNDGETALMKAASNGLVNNVRGLILAGANVNARDKKGKAAMNYALEANEPAVVRLLKAHGGIEFVVEEKQ